MQDLPAPANSLLERGKQHVTAVHQSLLDQKVAVLEDHFRTCLPRGWPNSGWQRCRPDAAALGEQTATLASSGCLSPGLEADHTWPEPCVVAFRLASLHVQLARCLTALAEGPVDSLTADYAGKLKALHSSMCALKSAKSGVKASSDAGIDQGNHFRAKAGH